MLSCVRGFATHWRWFLVNRAKAFAPISWALTGANSTPPPADTCAPINFIFRLLFICLLFFHKFPLRLFHIYKTVCPEPDTFIFQQRSLLRPARYQSALTVHHPMARQVQIFRHVVHRLPHHTRALRPAYQIGNLSVSHHAPRRNSGNNAVNILQKNRVIHKIQSFFPAKIRQTESIKNKSAYFSHRMAAWNACLSEQGHTFLFIGKCLLQACYRR